MAMSAASLSSSGEQHRRQPPPPEHRQVVGRPPGLEELDELLARRLVVPGALAPDDVDQRIDRLLAAAPGVERKGEVEAGLMVERVRLEPALELAGVAERRRLLGELDRGAGADDRRVVLLARRDHGEEALRALEIVEVEMQLRQRREGGDVLRVLR